MNSIIQNLQVGFQQLSLFVTAEQSKNFERLLNNTVHIINWPVKQCMLYVISEIFLACM